MGWLAKVDISWEQAIGFPVDEKRKLLNRNGQVDHYVWHQNIWKSFPNIEKYTGSKAPFLFRIEKKDSFFCCFILSNKIKPNCPEWCPAEYWAIKEIDDAFLEYEQYQFDLYANPTKSVKQYRYTDKNGNRLKEPEKKKNGSRIALFNESDQIKWLERKAEQHGFRLSVRDDDIPVVQIDKDNRHEFRKSENEKGVLFGVRFRGVLKVTDRERFTEAFYNGIGSAKGFGFGLLMLQPIRF